VTPTRMAWALWGLAIVLLIPGPALTLGFDLDAGGALFLIAFVALQLGASTAGAVVASRLPGNAVGWIFLGLGVGVGVALTANAWATLGLTTDAGPLPLDEFAAWVTDWLIMVVLAGPMLLLLTLFPTGRPVSPRWRRVTWALMTTLAVAAVAYALKPGMVGPDGDQTPNPMALPGAAGDVMGTIDAITTALALPAFALAVAAMVVRFRRSRGVERQQLKWFALASAVAGTALGASLAMPSGGIADWAILFALFGLAALPAAAGMAILRYRLYDVDVVINRTLVYGALTATLVGAYAGGVLLLQLALSPLTEESDLAIAGSTLAVAALFRPARARIQEAVDRRFYRRRYDAARTLEAFGARLRDQVDLDALGGELRDVVADTMQPAHVSLWLRGGPR
jgi:hypothetical protein